MNVLVTGVAGFIGAHVTKALLDRGDQVVGIDNFNDYYSLKLKEDRVKALIGEHNNFKLYKGDLSSFDFLEHIFEENKIDLICHMGAQAGVRYSLEDPFSYEKSNNLGTLNIFEIAKKEKVKKVVFASSSSVYGGNKKIPFSEEDKIDKTLSLYAATKRYNELLAYSYHHLFGIKMVGLRFFTVYGPWGRPDMAYYSFTNKIVEEKEIEIYNKGDMKRDFTYITDIVNGVIAAIDKEFDFEIFNLGNSKSVKINYFIELLEAELEKKAKKKLLPPKKTEVKETYADINKSRKLLGFNPEINIEVGIKKFITWYKKYHNQ